MLRSKRVTRHDRSHLIEARPAHGDSRAHRRNAARFLTKRKSDPVSLFSNFVSKDTQLLLRYWKRVLRSHRQIDSAISIEIRGDQISTIFLQRHGSRWR